MFFIIALLQVAQPFQNAPNGDYFYVSSDPTFKPALHMVIKKTNQTATGILYSWPYGGRVCFRGTVRQNQINNVEIHDANLRNNRWTVHPYRNSQQGPLFLEIMKATPLNKVPDPLMRSGYYSCLQFFSNRR